MTTETRNEAAEWLIATIDGPVPDPDAIAQPRNLAAEIIRRAMPGILAAERRATVERIRANVAPYATETILTRRLDSILDEEAAR